MKLQPLIALLKTHADEMANIDVTIVLGDYEKILQIEDIDFGYNDGVPYVQIIPDYNSPTMFRFWWD